MINVFSFTVMAICFLLLIYTEKNALEMVQGFLQDQAVNSCTFMWKRVCYSHFTLILHLIVQILEKIEVIPVFIPFGDLILNFSLNVDVGISYITVATCVWYTCIFTVKESSLIFIDHCSSPLSRDKVRNLYWYFTKKNVIVSSYVSNKFIVSAKWSTWKSMRLVTFTEDFLSLSPDIFLCKVTVTHSSFHFVFYFERGKTHPFIYCHVNFISFLLFYF